MQHQKLKTLVKTEFVNQVLMFEETLEFKQAILFIVVTYVQFDSNIRVLYVFWGFKKNTAQNTQSGKGYAKNHYRAAKNFSLLDSTVVNNLVTFSPSKSTISAATRSPIDA
jgi:hypothetical protein